jgi:hypothetical protein
MLDAEHFGYSRLHASLTSVALFSAQPLLAAFQRERQPHSAGCQETKEAVTPSCCDRICEIHQCFTPAGGAGQF